MKRQPKRKMVPACHSPPRRICFNAPASALTQIEVKKTRQNLERIICKKILFTKTCWDQHEFGNHSGNPWFTTSPAPLAEPTKKIAATSLWPHHENLQTSAVKHNASGRGILSNIRPATEAEVKTQKPRKKEAKHLV